MLARARFRDINAFQRMLRGGNLGFVQHRNFGRMSDWWGDKKEEASDASFQEECKSLLLIKEFNNMSYKQKMLNDIEKMNNRGRVRKYAERRHLKSSGYVPEEFEKMQMEQMRRVIEICDLIPPHATTKIYKNLRYADKIKIFKDSENRITISVLNEFLKNYMQYEELWQWLRKWQDNGETIPADMADMESRIQQGMSAHDITRAFKEKNKSRNKKMIFGQ